MQQQQRINTTLNISTNSTTPSGWMETAFACERRETAQLRTGVVGDRQAEQGAGAVQLRVLPPHLRHGRHVHGHADDWLGRGPGESDESRLACFLLLRSLSFGGRSESIRSDRLQSTRDHAGTKGRWRRWTRGRCACVCVSLSGSRAPRERMGLVQGEGQVDVGWASVWVKIASQWATAGLYLWTMMAPVLLPDRDFGW